MQAAAIEIEIDVKLGKL